MTETSIKVDRHIKKLKDIGLKEPYLFNSIIPPSNKTHN